jgi:glycosyltransferase involved in cell wall biosynthesis
MRIIFLNLFSPEETSGGIKITYRCAEILKNAGYDAVVWQPHGAPAWLEVRASVIDGPKFSVTPDDILIFPESLSLNFLRIIDRFPHVTKVLFCQNHYNMFTNEFHNSKTPRELGFSRILCVSHASKNILQRIFGYDDIAVMPLAIDPTLFRPREKIVQIAYAPKKLKWHADLIRRIFSTKYPDMHAVPWQEIHKASETRTAEIMGESQVYLSLSAFEALGLMPLEAMSAGCAVVGYHGSGGLEYATAQNGIWHYIDEIEEVVDALYSVAHRVMCKDPFIFHMIAEGQATAARFNNDAMQTALIDFIEATKSGRFIPNRRDAGTQCP